MNSRAAFALMVISIGFVIGFLTSHEENQPERIFFGGGLGAIIAVLLMGAFLMVFGGDGGNLDPSELPMGNGR